MPASSTRLMHLLLLSLLPLPLASASIGAEQQAAVALPDLILNPLEKDGPPTWVGEARAFDGAGGFRMELFHENFRSLSWVRELMNLPAGSCYEYGPTYISYIEAIPFSHLSQIAHDAPRILHGEVVARQGGFLGDTPGTLVRVRRSTELKAAEAGADFLFFLHLGEVQAGPRRICVYDPTLSPLPDVGDEIIVFARGHANDIGELVMATTMDAYLTIKDGEVYIPHRMSQECAPLRRRRADVLQTLEGARHALSDQGAPGEAHAHRREPCQPVVERRESLLAERGPCTLQDCRQSPLVLALPGAPYRFSCTDDGVWFDLTGDGVPERTAWTRAGDRVAFLVLDRNQNGVIDSGRELFGTSTPLLGWPDDYALSGFDALGQYDVDADAWITPHDPVWGRLRLWFDADHDGVSAPTELVPLNSVGLLALETVARGSRSRDICGNELRLKARTIFATPGGPRVRPWFDVFFRVEPP